ncbi:MAG: hypothetical protein RJA91_113 [Pseudomonadota bacterium]|jgi:hypothetical protein
MKKITKATIKSFIKKNSGKVYIQLESKFDGMIDGIRSINDRFSIAQPESKNEKYTFGISGAWFVGHSRDYFKAYEDEQFSGYYIYNSCGSFILATKK